MPSATAARVVNKKGDRITVTPSQWFVAAQTLLELRIPVMTWGDPGTGKTDMHKQLAIKMGMQFLPYHLSQIESVDLRGVPHVIERDDEGNSTHTTQFAQPDEFPRTGAGVFFLDEINRAMEFVKNPSLQLIREFRLGSYELPEDWVIMAASNYEYSGGTTRNSDALNSRFVHLYLDAYLEDFLNWGGKNKIHPLVLGFLRWRPEAFNEYSNTDHSFPCPRTYEMLSGICYKDLEIGYFAPLASGCIGQKRGGEFMSFVKTYKDLPDINDLIANPKTAVLLKDPCAQYAVATALGIHSTAKNYGNVLTYLERMSPDFMVMAVRDSTARDTSLCSTPAFANWALKNSDFICGN